MSMLYNNRFSWWPIDCLFFCVVTAKWFWSKIESDGGRVESRERRA